MNMSASKVPSDAARMHELRELLTRANRAYYADAAPFMSDQEFDTLLAELGCDAARIAALRAAGVV